MTLVRQIMSAFMAAAVVWSGLASAQSAHAHDAPDIGIEAHQMTTAHVDGDHAREASFSNSMVHHHDRGAPTPEQNEQDDTVFHVHGLCFSALTPDTLEVRHALFDQVIEPAELVVSLYSRSIMPADRPPRTFL